MHGSPCLTSHQVKLKVPDRYGNARVKRITGQGPWNETWDGLFKDRVVVADPLRNSELPLPPQKKTKQKNTNVSNRGVPFPTKPKRGCFGLAAPSPRSPAQRPSVPVVGAAALPADEHHGMAALAIRRTRKPGVPLILIVSLQTNLESVPSKNNPAHNGILHIYIYIHFPSLI